MSNPRAHDHLQALLRLVGLFAFVLVLGACGGGKGGGDAGTSSGAEGGGPGGGPGAPGGGGGLTANPGPQIALLISNGHSPLAPNYMSVGTGPQLANAITGAGYTLETSYFVDDAGGGASPGYAELVAKLAAIRDNWITGRSNPTRVVIVGHSHGCVRSHAAIRAVPDCPVRLLVDLDGSSAGWSILTHGPENVALGGAPEGAYNVNATIVCAAHPGVGSAPPPFDLEDIVFASVDEAYEVRSGDVLPNPANPLQLIEYDERWNARLDGSTTGLTCVFSGTNHTEVAAPGSVTLGAVQTWILARLGSD